MKNFIFSLLVAFSFSSCASFNSEDAKIITQITVPSAVQLAVAKEPKSREYFETVAVLIETFAGSSELTPEAFDNLLSSANVNELKTPEARAAIRIVISSYKAYYSKQVTVNNPQISEFLTVLAQAIRDGLFIVQPLQS